MNVGLISSNFSTSILADFGKKHQIGKKSTLDEFLTTIIYH